MNPSFAGRHVLAELTGADPATLDDEAGLRATVAAALTESGATVLQVVGHRFAPHGVTVVALLADSHASLHTWPERGAAFADVFTCGASADPELAVALLAQRLGATATTQVLPRGTAAPVREPIGPGLTRIWDVDEVIAERDTAYQHVLVARTAHGVTLFCDGERQSTEASQLVYHEALVVPALLLTPRHDRVLVIGSSEGVACQIAVAAGATHVDHVDIDAECVRLCAELLPYGYTPGELQRAEQGDGPVTVHYTDGAAFLDDAAEPYDVVVVDLPDERPDDPHAQHNRLYGTDFLRRAAAVLAPGGVVTGQAGCATLWRNSTLATSVERFRQVFPTVVPYTSDEHEWTFLTGAPTPVTDAVATMTDRLPTLGYRPHTLDAAALRRGAVLPHSLRRV